MVERLNIDAERLKLSKRADLHVICGDIRDAIAALESASAENTALREELEAVKAERNIRRIPVADGAREVEWNFDQDYRPTDADVRDYNTRQERENDRASTAEDGPENITDNPKSWIAWKREAERVAALNDEMWKQLDRLRDAVNRPKCGQPFMVGGRSIAPWGIVDHAISALDLSMMRGDTIEHYKSKAEQYHARALAAESSLARVKGGVAVEEDAAKRALGRVFAIQAEGTSQNETGYGAPFGPPFFIIDTSRAEPEVNWPGELIEQVDEVGEVGKRLNAARVAALLAALSAPADVVERSEAVADLAAMIDQYADEVIAYERASTRAETKAAAEDMKAAKARILAAAASSPAPGAVPGMVEGKPVKRPRLTEAMIRAACKGHYGTENIDGTCLTSHDIDWSFRDAFKRMWKGAMSAAPSPSGLAAPITEGGK
ncbi:hypothetical protein [Mesorhizobium sp.]|uniref:hypothetical protein n=1 Tax=Mesorhizobium sp. TaxID=1871066 RepID=UPI00121FF90C|nr:hypothetical protein [Mesorhizobium sp.]TIX28892.1 MAG: hypothetical protein E5V35_00595 [Mesorhizobium sp.]